MDDDLERNNQVPGREELAELWRTHLNLPHIAASEDFFEAGGSSMQVIEMLTSVSTRYGKEIDYAEFFKEPSLRKLGELLGST